jgi:sulfide:quinone oxidoreductase
MAGKTVLILGAGTGGLVLANRLRRTLAQNHRVVLVDMSPFYSFAPAFTRVMLGQRTAGRISRDLRTLSKRGIDVEIAEVRGLEPDRKTVVLSTGEQTYDYLVIALGAQYSAEEVPGLNKAWTFYHLDGAEGLRDELQTFEAGKVAIVVPRLPYKCPPAPYEGAFVLDHLFRKRKQRDNVEIHVYTPEQMPLTQAGKEVGEQILELLAERGIGFTGGVEAKSVNHEKSLVNFVEGEAAPFDLLVSTPIHRVPPVLVASGFAVEDGWVPVDRETLITNFEDVYCIGDANRVEIADGMYLPKAGVFAHGEAEVVYRNISAEISGGQPIWAYGGQGACFMETGGGHGAYISGDFFAEGGPLVSMRGPSRLWGLAKTGFERMWLWRWF